MTSVGAAELALLRNGFFFQSNFNERFWWCMCIKLNMVFFDEFPQNGFQLYTSLRLIERRCGCQIWKNVFVLKIRGLDNFSCDSNWYQKKVQSLQNSVQRTVCKKFLLHLQNLSLYLSQFTSVIFSGSDALFFEFSLKVFCFSCFCWPIFIIAMENQFDKICLDLNKMRGFLCENLTGGCQVMPQKPFWAHLPQITY